MLPVLQVVFPFLLGLLPSILGLQLTRHARLRRRLADIQALRKEAVPDRSIDALRTIESDISEELLVEQWLSRFPLANVRWVVLPLWFLFLLSLTLPLWDDIGFIEVAISPGGTALLALFAFSVAGLNTFFLYVSRLRLRKTLQKALDAENRRRNTEAQVASPASSSHPQP